MSAKVIVPLAISALLTSPSVISLDSMLVPSVELMTLPPLMLMPVPAV
ncbi:hypothetical protein IPO96_00750 [Candidatus Saccharibacteria bacterium]|nr:MAG: hypothetical protein IPO96_00750 [Candidatus Saccharibacteria bacterium]